MHVLTILDHPNPKSFSAAVAQTFHQGAQSAGHTVELADLHAEGFDPLWSMADINGDGEGGGNGGGPPPDIRAQHDRIARADAVAFVFPLFWWGMPAMTKGWVDRVWTWGWAYDQLDDPEVSLQRPRRGLLLVPAGARSDEMHDRGYTSALETIWMGGTFGYFGFVRRDLVLLHGATGSAARRDALLARAYDAGKALRPVAGCGDDQGKRIPS
ncbi:NAD(P)H-dependent oxidoreductase [Roseobacter sp.]|uniref:NAD(P)H-dependent oxidoreductase n=1 Tax=Roseobacter sp. TaxID=1907202 RepID=UPI0032973F7E